MGFSLRQPGDRQARRTASGSCSSPPATTTCRRQGPPLHARRRHRRGASSRSSTGVGTATSPSGLAKISAWVDDGLGRQHRQRVYGGDLLGNLWRFDVTTDIRPPARRLRSRASRRRRAPCSRSRPSRSSGLISGFPVLYVGTGRYLGPTTCGPATRTPPDSATRTRSLYDLIRTAASGDAATAAPGTVVQQTSRIIDAGNTRSTSNNPVDFGDERRLVPRLQPGQHSRRASA